MDALLGALDRLIAKKRDLKQAAMQQLLTGQTRLPGFHGEWEVKTAGCCGEDSVRANSCEDKRTTRRAEFDPTKQETSPTHRTPKKTKKYNSTGRLEN